MRKIFTFLSPILCCLLLSACLNRNEFSEEELQALVDSELERRINNFTKIKKNRCKDQLLEAAQAKVDSLLFEEARNSVDALVPSPIARPEKPDIREVKDTRPIVPLFDSLEVLEEIDTSHSNK